MGLYSCAAPTKKIQVQHLSGAQSNSPEWPKRDNETNGIVPLPLTVESVHGEEQWNLTWPSHKIITTTIEEKQLLPTDTTAATWTGLTMLVLRVRQSTDQLQ